MARVPRARKPRKPKSAASVNKASAAKRLAAAEKELAAAKKALARASKSAGKSPIRIRLRSKPAKPSKPAKSRAAKPSAKPARPSSARQSASRPSARGPTKSGKPASKPAKAARKAAPKRPPEVSKERWAKLGERQRRRYEAFYRKHPGAPLYRARGKQPREARTRRERIEARIEALSERQAYRSGPRGRDADAIADSLRRMVAAEGDGALAKLERAIRDRQKGEGRITADELDFDWADYDGDDDDLRYH